LSNVKLGKVIEKIISKVKKEEEPSAKTLLDIPTAPTTPASPASTVPRRIYLKASVLRSLGDLDTVKNEVKSGNILIVRLGPLAEKNMDDVKRAVAELSEFAEQIGGDIARLGEERIVVTPFFVKVWREKTAEP